MKAEEVAAYLQDHPEFFEQQADMLAEIFIPHPHGGRTISISERQILTLREKSKQLESKLREIIQFGEENDEIGEKVHRLTLALLGARDIEAVLNAVGFNLREDFDVPHAVLRIWRGSGPGDLPEFAEVGEATRAFAADLINPHCGTQAMADTLSLFGEAGPHLRSFAYVALRDKEAFGLLALASEDAQRFYPDMGTVYLKRLGDMAGKALLKYLDPA
jgi:uncharacterized protein YigA (DUF484 family)